MKILREWGDRWNLGKYKKPGMAAALLEIKEGNKLDLQAIVWSLDFIQSAVGSH